MKSGLIIFAGFGILAGVLLMFHRDRKKLRDQFTEEQTDFAYCESSQTVQKCEQPVLLRNEQEQCIHVLWAKGCCAYRSKKTGELHHFDVCEG